MGISSSAEDITRHGGSSHAWIQIPNVPCLKDSSAGSVIGVSSELDCSVFVNVCNSIGTPEPVLKFSVRVLSHHDLVVDQKLLFTSLR